MPPIASAQNMNLRYMLTLVSVAAINSCWLAASEPAIASRPVSVTRAELKDEHRWAEENLLSRRRSLPFSFTYGGRAAAELLPAWELKRATAKPQPGRRLRTVTCSDPMTGLLVRCDLTEFEFDLTELRLT